MVKHLKKIRNNAAKQKAQNECPLNAAFIRKEE